MNNVFKIKRISRSEQVFQYCAEVDAAHPVFRGHFPQMPVVPGVCTMNMIKECLSDALSHPVRYGSIKECKFLSAITPSEHKQLDVTITIKQDCDVLNVIAEVIVGETIMMKLKATLV